MTVDLNKIADTTIKTQADPDALAAALTKEDEIGLDDDDTQADADQKKDDDDTQADTDQKKK